MGGLPPIGNDRILDTKAAPDETQTVALFREALAARTMMAFVGSGMTVAIGGPRWSQLVDRVCGAGTADEIGRDHYVSAISRVLENGAPGAEPKFGMRDMRELFDENIEPVENFWNDDGEIAHRSVAHNPIEALLDLDIRRFCTTNYDTAIERTIHSRTAAREFGNAAMCGPSRSRHSFTSLKDDSEFQLRFASARPSTHTSTEAPKVWHLHGRFDSWESLVIGQQAYDDLYIHPGEKAVSSLSSQFLSATLGSSPVFFAGYSLSDQDLAVILRIRRLNHKSYEGIQPLFGIFEYEGTEESDDRARDNFWGQYRLGRITYVRDYCTKHRFEWFWRGWSCVDCLQTRHDAIGGRFETQRDRLFCATHLDGLQKLTASCDPCRRAHGTSVAERIRELGPYSDDYSRRHPMLQPVRLPGSDDSAFAVGRPDFSLLAEIAELEGIKKPTPLRNADGTDSTGLWADPSRTDAPTGADSVNGVSRLTVVRGRAGTARSLSAELLCARLQSEATYRVARWDLAESGDLSSLVGYLSSQIDQARRSPGTEASTNATGFEACFERLLYSDVVVLIDGIEHILWPGRDGRPASALAERLFACIAKFVEQPDSPECRGRIVLTTEQMPSALRALSHRDGAGGDLSTEQDGSPSVSEVEVPEIPFRAARAFANNHGLEVDDATIRDLIGLLRGAAGVLRIAAVVVWRGDSSEGSPPPGVHVHEHRARRLLYRLAGNPGTRRDRVFAYLAAGREVEYRTLLTAMALAFVPMKKKSAEVVCRALIEGGAMHPMRRPHNEFSSREFEIAWTELIFVGLLVPATQAKGAFVISDFGRRQVLAQAGYSDGSAGRSLRALTGTTAPGPSITAGRQGGDRTLGASRALIGAAEEHVNWADLGVDVAENRMVANEHLRVALGLIRSRFETRSATPTVHVDDVLKEELRILNCSRRLASTEASWRVSREDPNVLTASATFTLGELGWLYNDIAIGLYATGRTDQAAAAYSRGHEVHHLLSHRIGTESYQAQSRLHFGHLSIARGDLNSAAYFFDKTREVLPGLGDVFGTDMAQRLDGYEAVVAHLRNDPGTAERLFKRALADYLDGDLTGELNRRATAKFLTHYAYLLMDMGLTETCGPFLREAKGLAEGSSATDLHVFATLAEAELLRRSLKFTDAAERLRTARALASSAHLRRMMVEVELQDAQLHLARGETKRARQTALEMLRTSTAVGLLLRQTRAIELLGTIALAQDRHDAAIDCFRVALDRARRQEYLRRVATISLCLERMGVDPQSSLHRPPAETAGTEDSSDDVEIDLRPSASTRPEPEKV